MKKGQAVAVESGSDESIFFFIPLGSRVPRRSGFRRRVDGKFGGGVMRGSFNFFFTPSLLIVIR